MKIKESRHAGILMHISSLPTDYGIGDLGKSAYAMADLINKAGFDHWQILPLGPTGFGNSPYAARSTFAGNELFIDLDHVLELGLLNKNDLLAKPTFRSEFVDYDAVIQWKLPLLKQAAKNFLALGMRSALYEDYTIFCKSEDYWLSDYALFMSLYEDYQDARWFSHWPQQYAKRSRKALRSYYDENRMKIEIWQVMQFFFHVQWKRFRRYVNALGIRLIGDIPIFVAADSVDTWSNSALFKTDALGNFSHISGVPPDFFSATGQLWGNPVYDWPSIAADDYRWWMQRLTKSLQFVDIIRIDHFRGFDAYWEVPAGSPTAETGTWVEAPGKEFFQTIKQKMGTIPIIAEDLGVVTPSVEQLRDSNGFPGMKIFQFGFVLDSTGKLDAHEEFLTHNYPYGCVAYTGTHDNDTSRGWFDSITPQVQRAVCDYLDCSEDTVVWAMMRALFASHAQTTIVPVQDIFDLDSSARMNRPSTCGPSNWSWCLSVNQMNDFPIDRLVHLLQLFGRYPLTR